MLCSELTVVDKSAHNSFFNNNTVPSVPPPTTSRLAASPPSTTTTLYLENRNLTRKRATISLINCRLMDYKNEKKENKLTNLKTYANRSSIERWDWLSKCFLYRLLLDLKSSSVRSSTGDHEHGDNQEECAQFTRAGCHDLALIM